MWIAVHATGSGGEDSSRGARTRPPRKAQGLARRPHAYAGAQTGRRHRVRGRATGVPGRTAPERAARLWTGVAGAIMIAHPACNSALGRRTGQGGSSMDGAGCRHCRPVLPPDTGSPRNSPAPPVDHRVSISHQTARACARAGVRALSDRLRRGGASRFTPVGTTSDGRGYLTQIQLGISCADPAGSGLHAAEGVRQDCLERPLRSVLGMGHGHGGPPLYVLSKDLQVRVQRHGNAVVAPAGPAPR